MLLFRFEAIDTEAGEGGVNIIAQDAKAAHALLREAADRFKLDAVVNGPFAGPARVLGHDGQPFTWA